MNSLVKSLIFPLLESEQKGVALIPGGFKPPTIGHFVLVDEVAQNPNFDKVIVLIGHKVRDGVTKEESLAIWDIYKKYLPSNVEIKISDNSSPIADISSLIKNNPDTYFYPVVGIRGEMDLGDIKRFDSLEGKYPNFKTVVIRSEERENRVSGTNTRTALIGGKKEIFQQYLPSQLTDEEKDSVWSILTKTPLNEVLPKNENLSPFDLSPFDFDQDGNESRIKRTINNNQGWRRLGSDSEQNKQIKAYLDKYTSNFKWSNPPISEKFSKENKSMYNTPYVMYVHLLQTSEGVNNIKEALQGMIANEPDNTQKIIENALLLVFNNDEAKFKLVVEQYKDIIEKNAGDDDGANPFAAIKYAVSNFKDKKGIFNKFVRNGWSAGTFNLNETFFKNFLNEGYAEPSKFDYPKQLKSLTEFMLDKGMNIRPLPKVKFIENDVENAKDFFGKTAYYNPNQRVIVLYTMDRHPKDIMRSFAHEMIHHIQNLEGRIGDGRIKTTDTNKDDYLQQIEKEAYLKGNITFRNWTDTLTEGVLKEGRYDTISNKISGDIFNYWKKDFEEYIQALNINTKGFEEDDLALPNPQEKSTPSPTIKEPLNENKPITIDMGKVNKALLKGMGHEKETDENILATIDAHPPGKVPHTTFLDFYAKFDKYFGEKDDDRVLDETGLEHILVNVLKLSPEDIKIVMDDYQKGNKDLEDVNWFEKYDTTHQKDEEWNPAGGKKFDDSKDTKSSVDNYLSKNKKLHEKKGFDKKLGKDPFGLNQFAREIMQEEEGSDTFDYLKHLKLLTNHMLNKGINLRPLPTVKFINDDGENAKDFFGKTAYYNPNSNQIVLYTLNRHPKDVMRSFAHEMIHHHQNCEDRLGNITTQNTNEEGDLPEIEREAYTKGTMTFREWTDTLTEGILKENTEEEDDGTLSYESIFKPDINILVAFKNYKNYFQLKPLFDEHGYGFYYPEDKIIILNGERFVNSNLDFKDLKFVEAHEITHLLLGHTGPYSEEDEMDADLGAYILLKNKKLSTDRLVNEFENRHGVPFTEELLERVKNRL